MSLRENLSLRGKQLLRSVRSDEDVDITVEIAPEAAHDVLIDVCNSTEDRWLYAGTPHHMDRIWLLRGELDESPVPVTDRMTDAISHETMHIVIENLVGTDVSEQYDDLLLDVVDSYLHRYPYRGDEE